MKKLFKNSQGGGLQENRKNIFFLSFWEFLDVNFCTQIWAVGWEWICSSQSISQRFPATSRCHPFFVFFSAKEKIAREQYFIWVRKILIITLFHLRAMWGSWTKYFFSVEFFSSKDSKNNFSVSSNNFGKKSSYLKLMKIPTSSGKKSPKLFKKKSFRHSKKIPKVSQND